MHSAIALADMFFYMQRSYWYARGEYEYDESQSSDSLNAVCIDPEDANCTSPNLDGVPGLGMPLSRKSWIDYEVTNENTYPKVCINHVVQV